MILGRPTLNRLKVATLTYCLKVKFPTPHRIEEIHGDQLLAQECYEAMLASKENHTWMVEKKPEKPSKDLEDVELVEGDPSKVNKIGPDIDSPIKEKIVEFLKKNIDVFAWTHEDKPGIDSKVIEHRLNVDSTKKPVHKSEGSSPPKGIRLS